MPATLNELVATLASAEHSKILVALQVFTEVAPDLPTYRASLEQGMIEAGIIPLPDPLPDAWGG